MIAIAFAFVPASVVAIIVREREINVKHLQLISGVDTFAVSLPSYSSSPLFFLAHS